VPRSPTLSSLALLKMAKRAAIQLVAHIQSTRDTRGEMINVHTPRPSHHDFHKTCEAVLGRVAVA
jgi:hypothetical protein